MKAIMLIVVSMLFLTGCNLNHSTSPIFNFPAKEKEKPKIYYYGSIEVKTEKGTPCDSAMAHWGHDDYEYYYDSYVSDINGIIYLKTNAPSDQPFAIKKITVYKDRTNLSIFQRSEVRLSIQGEQYATRLVIVFPDSP